MVEATFITSGSAPAFNTSAGVSAAFVSALNFNQPSGKSPAKQINFFHKFIPSKGYDLFDLFPFESASSTHYRKAAFLIDRTFPRIETNIYTPVGIGHTVGQRRFVMISSSLTIID